MRFRAEWSQGGGIDGPWKEAGLAEASGDDIGPPVLREVAQDIGLYRVAPADVSDQGYAYYWLDAEGQVERRYFGK